jgi:hypothetical protein
VNTLKTYWENELKWFIWAYLLFVIGVNNPELFNNPDVETLTKIFNLFTSAIISGVICSLAFVFDSLYTSALKDVLVFFRRSKVPGATVFTRIKNGKMKDVRFDTAKAFQKYESIISGIPLEEKLKGKYENAEWYKLYSKNRDVTAVLSVHRDSLLCRDLYITTISLAVLTGAMMAVRLLLFNWILLGYLLVMLILTNIAAHNKAHRFVNTVIAIDIAEY